MKAMSVIPGRRGSELIADLPDPPAADGSVLAEGLLAGICGTDREVLDGAGQPPGGGPRLVIGHESLGRVLEAPSGAPVRPGDLVVGVVRRPDPVPCPACAAGQWDFCANGRYLERGIAVRSATCARTSYSSAPARASCSPGWPAGWPRRACCA